ncbi:MAG: autotransporter outer membrane beta-barrel domain-containing protein [Proteobacteria bacterium]|nr:autotransporter outer membrane beta-barrel domain-containing protein [Pseudomonadota bacterium]
MKLKLLLSILMLGTTATVQSETDPTIPTRMEYAQALVSALGTDGPRFRQTIGALAEYCATEEFFFTGLGGNCDRLFFAALEGNGDAIKRLLRRLRPREVVQQSRTSNEIMSTQQSNISSRLSQVRAGMSHSIAGLSISVGGKDLPLEMLSYLSEANDPDGPSNYDQLFTPWGFFINGQITSGDYQYADARDEGFDFDSKGLTMGVDYRLNSQAVIGAAVGYANFDSTVDIGARVESTAMTFSAYGSFNVTDNFYIDARASFGNPDYKQRRSVDFTLQENRVDQVAIGSTKGSQQSYIISSGYQFNKNGWQFTPSASTEFYQSKIDAFVETGTGAYNVGFSEQNFETTRFTLGFQTSKTISLRNGVLIPSLGYTLVQENQKGDEFILMRISGMPAGEFFESSTGFNDDNYSTLDLGVSFVVANGKQAFIQYSKALGWDGFDRNTINLGARFEF